MKILLNFKYRSENTIAPEGADFVDTQYAYDHPDEIEAMICYGNMINEENVSKFKNLKWVQIMTSGYDYADTNALKSRGIAFTNANSAYRIPLAEDIFLKMLMMSRNVKQYIYAQAEHKWKAVFPVYELYGKTVGLVGVGAIAKEVAKRAKAFDMNVIGYSRSGREYEHFDKIYCGDAGLREVMSKSDYVVISIPLTNETKSLINKEKILLMKGSAFLINISRGAAVSQDDLIECLRNKVIAGAAIDVTVPEPLPADSKLWDVENLFITPHQAGFGDRLHERLNALIYENIVNFMSGKPLNNIINLQNRYVFHSLLQEYVKKAVLQVLLRRMQRPTSGPQKRTAMFFTASYRRRDASFILRKNIEFSVSHWKSARGGSREK